jgi:hypothetical protein
MGGQPDAEPVKSEALQKFEKHAKKIAQLIELMGRDQGHAFDPMKEAINRVKDLKVRNMEISVPKAGGDVSDEVKGLITAWQGVEHFVELLTFLNDWMLVMVVSFTEAYLEDVLALLVGRNPAFMGDLKLKVSYAELTAAASLAEDMQAMRGRWQECFINNFLREKPQQWIKLLEGFGAKAYPAGLAEEMTTVWRRRHAIVHSEVTGHMSLGEFKKALGIIDSFLKPTDRFVVGFLEAHS